MCICVCMLRCEVCIELRFSAYCSGEHTEDVLLRFDFSGAFFTMYYALSRPIIKREIEGKKQEELEEKLVVVVAVVESRRVKQK